MVTLSSAQGWPCPELCIPLPATLWSRNLLKQIEVCDYYIGIRIPWKIEDSARRVHPRHGGKAGHSDARRFIAGLKTIELNLVLDPRKN
ncbi:MAG: hypothetical protein P8J18_10380 [Halieaceae bacterium]|nr:hypothetical protein [Halieaceae bacterium]